MVLARSSRDFIQHWGEMGTRWGVNRTVAQIHALLYLSPAPLTAEEIAETLSIARSNVSNSIKELQNWNLIQVVHAIGDRCDRFQTDHDVWALFVNVIDQRVAREIVPTLSMLRRCAPEARSEAAASAADAPLIAERISSMEAFMNEIHGWYQQIKTLPPTTLRSHMHFGTGITRLLPTMHNNTGADR